MIKSDDDPLNKQKIMIYKKIFELKDQNLEKKS